MRIKHTAYCLVSLIALSGCNGQSFSKDGLASGLMGIANAATLSNEEVAAKSLDTAQALDNEAQIAPPRQRL